MCVRHTHIAEFRHQFTHFSEIRHQGFVVGREGRGAGEKDARQAPGAVPKFFKIGACAGAGGGAYYSLRESAVNVGVAELADALA